MMLFGISEQLTIWSWSKLQLMGASNGHSDEVGCFLNDAVTIRRNWRLESAIRINWNDSMEVEPRQS